MGNLSQKNIITSWNDRYSVCRGQPYYELKSWHLQVVCPVATEMPSAVVDPDLELRGRGVGGLVFIYLPCWLFSLWSYLSLLTQNEGGPGPLP